MAVIISNGATNLSTPNAFYRVEAHNLGQFNLTGLALTTTRQIPVTFANAGNCRGVVLKLVGASNSLLRTVTVELQELVAAVWTTRTSVTLNATQMFNAVTNSTSYWIIPFEFATPFAVNTTAGIWQFNISQGGSGATLALVTSNGSAPFYATWCNNLVSFVNNDSLICKDVVTIDGNCSFRGVLGTGDAATAPAITICRSNTPTADSVSNLVWATSPAASWTMTIDGVIATSAHSGFRIGTSSNRIPFAQQAIVSFITPTVGTNSGIRDTWNGAGGNGVLSGKTSLFFYGEIPTVQRTTLAANALIGQPNIITSDVTGWNVGDPVFVGRQTTRGAGDTTLRTISAISGTTITLSSNLTGSTRVSGGAVVRLNGYGVYLKAASANNIYTMQTRGYSNLAISGVQSELYVNSPTFLLGHLDDAANATVSIIEHSSFYNTTQITGIYNDGFATTMQYVNFVRSGWALSAGGAGRQNIIDNCWTLSSDLSFANTTATNCTTSNCRWEGMGNVGDTTGSNFTFTDNQMWGTNNSSRTFSPTGIFYPASIARNEYNNCRWGISMIGSVLGWVEVDSSFGNIMANDEDIGFGGGGGTFFIDMIQQSPAGNVTFAPTINTASIAAMVTGKTTFSALRFTDYNNAINDDRIIAARGTFQRTGFNLADTTVHLSGTSFGAATAGKFAMRQRSSNGNLPLYWFQNVPTGNIQNRTMSIGIWCKINSAAYYAGTHALPRLTVTFDNGTEVFVEAIATTDGQYMTVSFTPLTTFGQISVSVSTQTGAAGANADVYFDDISILYPAGYSLDLGLMDLWANALPVSPTIATFPNAGTVWDELIENHIVVGSFGEQATRTDIVTSDNQALILVK